MLLDLADRHQPRLHALKLPELQSGNLISTMAVKHNKPPGTSQRLA